MVLMLRGCESGIPGKAYRILKTNLEHEKAYFTYTSFQP